MWRSSGEVTAPEYERALEKVRPMVELLRKLIASSGAQAGWAQDHQLRKDDVAARRARGSCRGAHLAPA